MLSVAGIDCACVDLKPAGVGMRPARLEQFVQLHPRRVVIVRPPDHDMAQDQALARARPAGDGALESVILHVDADR